MIEELERLLIGKTKDQIIALGDLEEYIKENITDVTINSVIMDVEISSEYRFMINGYSPFHIVLSENVCIEVL